MFVLKFVSANLKLPARSTVQEEGVSHASPSEADSLSGKTGDFTDTMLYFADPSGKTACFTDNICNLADLSGKTADFTDYSERRETAYPSGLSAKPTGVGPPITLTKKSLRDNVSKAFRRKWQLPTLPPGGAVPSAMVSLTSLFGMGRGGSSPL